VSRRLILPVASAAVVAAVIVLALKVRARPETAVDASDLEQAQARYRRRSDAAHAVPALDRAQARAAAAAGAPGAAPPAPDPAPPFAATPIEPAPVPREPPGGVTLDTGPDDALKASMDEANRLFDRSDYPGAEAAALDILAHHPRNIRMLRIVVSSACASGNTERAKEYYAALPARDQAQMRSRCGKWGIQLGDDVSR
jgi:hypothetical protein